MDRRRFVAGMAGALAAPLALAQEKRTYRVALVLTTSLIAEMAGPDPAHPPTRVILHELRAFGYVEGRNLIFERRSAEGNPGRYPEIVAELIRLKTDAIILAGSRNLIRAVQAATRSIPIVLMGYPTAVEHGFVASLARPGGNITGLTGLTGGENDGKRLQLLKEMVPALSRVAYLALKGVWESEFARPLRVAAAALGVELLLVEQHPTDPEKSFSAIAQLRVDGLFVASSAVAYGQREHLGRLAFAARLPASFEAVRTVETGGLMSYAPNISDHMRRVAQYVDKILKGANPGDLPMEQPTKFEMVINLRTAKALGLKIPPSILLRADRVIE